MNENQKKVSQFMDQRIQQLEKGMDHLQDRDCQPGEMGELYNGMLRSTVSFEIEHLQALKQELIQLF